jgi:hypothetical protein
MPLLNSIPAENQRREIFIEAEKGYTIRGACEILINEEKILVSIKMGASLLEVGALGRCRRSGAPIILARCL